MKQHISESLKLALGIGMTGLILSYPFILRDWIFDNIPRSWTLSGIKPIFLILPILTILPAFVFLLKPLLTKKYRKHDSRFIKFFPVMGVIFAALFAPFWQSYNNDRTWITADYLDRTNKEIEMSTIGEVMQEDEILGFHYRALFLKAFHSMLFPFGIILPMLILALGEFIKGKDSFKLSLTMVLLLLFLFWFFGMLLYG